MEGDPSEEETVEGRGAGENAEESDAEREEIEERGAVAARERAAEVWGPPGID